MKTLFLSFALLLASAGSLHATDTQKDSVGRQKAAFTEAKKELQAMLSGAQPLSYERAVFLLENAWWAGALNWKTFQQDIDANLHLVRAFSETGYQEQDYSNLKAFELAQMSIPQRKRTYKEVLSNWAIFKYLTDTTYYAAGNTILYHRPFRYSFADPLSTSDWKHTHVTNLLLTGEGNCFALASLYKIFSERLQSGAWLSVAPGHIFIRHNDVKGIPYNLELSSGVFPGSGTIETFTHTSREAVMNNIAMRDLDLKQSVALCLVYLAKGYEFKFGEGAKDDFVLSCAGDALREDPLSLPAMLLKAEVLEREVLKLQLPAGKLQKVPVFVQYQKWVQHLFELGHREMPLQMKNLLIKGWTKDSLASIQALDYRLSGTSAGIPNTALQA